MERSYLSVVRKEMELGRSSKRAMSFSPPNLYLWLTVAMYMKASRGNTFIRLKNKVFASAPSQILILLILTAQFYITFSASKN